MIPARVYWIGGVALAIALAIGLWLRSHDNKVRRQAVAEAVAAAVVRERARSDSMNAVLRDSLSRAQARVDTVRIRVAGAAADYERERAKLDTTAAAQPPNVPEGHVVVPVVYVRMADSLAALVPVLIDRGAEERAASALRISGLMRSDSLTRVENAQLRIQLQTARLSNTDRIKWASIGGAVTVVAAVGLFALLQN